MPPTPELGWSISWWAVLGGATYLLALLSIPSVLLQRRGNPQAAVSWVLVLFSLPVVGLFLWWAIGRRHLRRRNRKRQRATARVAQSVGELQAVLPAPPEAEWELMPIQRMPTGDSDWVFPPTTDNCGALLADAEQAYPEIERLIDRARHHLHIQFYIWRDDATGRHFRDLLVEKARQGVEVRLLLDAVGSNEVRGRFLRPLRDAGAGASLFMPPRFIRRRLDLNFRNHRKLVLADSREGVIGGLNIGDEYRDRWRDMALWLSGPVVDQLQEVFVDDWFFVTGDEFVTAEHFGGWRGSQGERASCGDDPRTVRALCGLVPSGPHTEHNLTHEAFFLAINQAHRRIRITTPYFIPSQTILAALRSAAFRGVDVQVLLPERADKRLVDWASRSYWPTLLRSGVRLMLYRDGVLHSKTALFDDDLSFVGSANMDIRSFKLNFELGCFVQSHELNRQLTALFDEDVQRSRAISLDEVERTSYLARLGEATAHLMSPLL